MGKFTTVKKVKKNREKKLGFNWFFWISFIVVLIPCAYFVYLLLEASKVSNTPIIGSRINDTVSHQISQQQVEEVSDTIKHMESVEDCEVNLIVQTLRITVNVKDSVETETFEELISDIYASVNEKLPVETYFTKDGELKQYDLEITIYDNMTLEEPTIIILVKNSSMEAEEIQILSQPKNAEVADELTHQGEEPEDDDDDEIVENAA